MAGLAWLHIITHHKWDQIDLSKHLLTLQQGCSCSHCMMQKRPRRSCKTQQLYTFVWILVEIWIMSSMSVLSYQCQTCATSCIGLCYLDTDLQVQSFHKQVSCYFFGLVPVQCSTRFNPWIHIPGTIKHCSTSKECKYGKALQSLFIWEVFQFDLGVWIKGRTLLRPLVSWGIEYEWNQLASLEYYVSFASVQSWLPEETSMQLNKN